MEEPRWQGTIRRFFDTLFHELPGLVALNLLFLLTLLPVVTLGPALSALARVGAGLAEGNCPHPARAYLTWFRVRLSLTLPLGLALGAVYGVLGVSLLIYGGMAGGNPLFLPLVSLSLLLILALTGVLIHLLPALTAEAASLSTLAAAAARRLYAHLPGTLVAAALLWALLTAQVLAFPAALPLSLTLGCSVPALVGGFAVRTGA